MSCEGKVLAQQSTHSFSNYLKSTRQLQTSFLLVLPLFVIYQVGILGTGGVRNGVDFVTDVFIWMVGFVASWFFDPVSQGIVFLGYLGANGALFLFFCFIVWRRREENTIHPKMFVWLLGESLIYAILLGGTVHLVEDMIGLKNILQVKASFSALALDQNIISSPFVILVQSIGAGLYEEFVFRLLLLGLGYRFLCSKEVPPIISGAVAVIVSSLVFSAVHHLGPMGDDFALSIFSFRFFAGVLLALIFSLRGFAVAVYAHAIYDIIVMGFALIAG
jgi:membrane protease YdiL (CAAX protease family)